MAKVITRMVTSHPAVSLRRIRVLNIMGMRAEESPARAKLVPFYEDKQLSKNHRVILAGNGKGFEGIKA